MKCGEMLMVVVREVCDVLREFCHGSVTTEYLIDPKGLKDQCFPQEVNSLQLYLLSDVKRVLAGGNMVVSVRGGRGGMMSSDIDILRQYPLWGKLKSCVSCGELWLTSVGGVVYLYGVWLVICNEVMSSYMCCINFRLSHKWTRSTPRYVGSYSP